MVFEGLFDGKGFALVIEGCAGSVGIYVADLLGPDACGFDGPFHGEDGSPGFRVWAGDVVGVS